MKSTLPPVVGPAGPVDMLARNLAKRAGAVRTLSLDFVSTSNVPVLVTDIDTGDWALEVEAGTFYRFTVLGKYTSANASTGCQLRVVAQGAAAGIVFGHAQVDTQPINAREVFGRGAPALTALTQSVNGLPFTVASPGVIGEGEVFVDLGFFCAVAGVLEVQWATSVNTQAATLLTGSSLITQTLFSP